MRKSVYLILGASSDLGLALIERLNAETEADENRIFIAHYHSSSDRLKAIPIKAQNALFCVCADFSNPESIENFIAEVKAINPCPSHIVHLAAEPFRYMKLKEFQREVLLRAVDVQLCAFLRIAREFLPEMAKRKQHDKIIIITSYVVNRPPKFMLDYIVAKYALLGAMKSLAADYEGKMVNINAVSPSMIETKFLKNIDSRIVELTAEKSPEGRNASTEDIVGVIDFLLSNSANYIHGQNIAVDNGAGI